MPHLLPLPDLPYFGFGFGLGASPQSSTVGMTQSQYYSSNSAIRE
jgi:hypothetical protein